MKQRCSCCGKLFESAGGLEELDQKALNGLWLSGIEETQKNLEEIISMLEKLKKLVKKNGVHGNEVPVLLVEEMPQLTHEMSVKLSKHMPDLLGDVSNGVVDQKKVDTYGKKLSKAIADNISDHLSGKAVKIK